MKFFIFIFLFTFLGEVKADSKEFYKTKEEFDKELNEKLEKRLKQIGQNKILNFAKDLMEKEKDLELRAVKLDQREDELKSIKTEIDEKIKGFSKNQEKILGCLTDNENKEQKRVEHIVDIISGMRPQKSAEILSVQDPEIAIKILEMLDSAKISKIFNFMDKEVSARLQKQYLTMKK